MENENSTMRTDIETANRTILAQIEIIKGLKSQLDRVVGENRRFIRGIKRK
jgi:flagellin-specific chaperone FliS